VIAIDAEESEEESQSEDDHLGEVVELGEQIESESEPEIQSPNINDWVAVRFKGRKRFEVFIGNVIKIDNKLANVKFVKLYRRNFFIFPENEDIADVSIRDNVMMKLSQPERVGQTSFREGGFQFNEAEVEKAMAILLK